MEASIEFVTPVGSTRGRSKNVSEGGLAANVTRPVPPGSQVLVRMSLVFDEDSFSEPLALPARVVWCTPIGAMFQLGASFLPMSGEKQSYLAMFLRYLEGTLQMPEQRPGQQDVAAKPDDDGSSF
jgi:hypothetical protein